MYLQEFENAAAMNAATPTVTPWVGAELDTRTVRYVKD
jgi:hypothetical protein